MCGLVGIFGLINHQEKKVFKTLHHFSVLRGEDGAGVYYTTRPYGKVEPREKLLKIAGLPCDLAWYNDDEFDGWGLIKEYGLNLLLGHNRAATSSSISDDNAHPFSFENIVGVHNGTIVRSSLDKFPLSKAKGLVDSEVVLDGINEIYYENGAFNTFQEVIDEVEGSAAFIWWDRHDRILNFYRNNRRTLFMVSDDKGENLFWASEKWMLEVALSREGIKYGKNGGIVSLKENTHVQYVFRNSKVVCTNIETIEPTGNNKVKPVSVTAASYFRYPGSYGRYVPANPVVDVKEKPKLTVVKNTEDKEENPFVILFGSILTRKELEEQLEDGCCVCMKELSFEERHETKWYDKRTPICYDCQGKPLELLLGAGANEQMEQCRDIH